VTAGSCWSEGPAGAELTGGVAVVEAVVEALVLALPGRGSVDVVAGSAEDVSTSEVVSAEAAGCEDCWAKDTSPPPPEGNDCGTAGRPTDCTAVGDSWKSEVAGRGEKIGRLADPSNADSENMISGVAEEAGAVEAGAGVTASGGAPAP
jgi:hypothetical protein